MIVRYRTGEPLTATMDNVLAWRLGEIVAKAAAASAGDPIDRGLILRRLLEEAGFTLFYKELPY